VAITRPELIAALGEIVTRAQALIKQLEDQPAGPPAEELGKCPIHNVNWRRTRYGIAHPPAQEGGKWCNKDAVDKLR